jgi:uncharacterized membrane protein
LVVIRGGFVDSVAVLILSAIPSQAIASDVVGGAVFVIGVVVLLIRGDWVRARGFDKLILLGPIFYAAPIAAFGTEHFTLTRDIASIVPAWIPWHMFWGTSLGPA